ncbi:MAG TPA: hypothetical protein VFV02_02030, partial [Acidimicrobiales bacterium]|nr:hypothetical protein [Acidimicrobiales bacterium]
FYLRLSRRIYELDEAAVVRTLDQVLDGIRTPSTEPAAGAGDTRAGRRAEGDDRLRPAAAGGRSGTGEREAGEDLSDQRRGPA